MSGVFDDSAGAEPVGRFSAARLLLRLVVIVALPVVGLGAGLWWFVRDDSVSRAVEIQAQANDRIVDLAIGDHLVALSDTITVVDPAVYTAARAQLVVPMLGEHLIRVIDPSGRVVLSDSPDEVGAVVRLTPGNRSALEGIPAGEPSADSTGVVYSLPWAPPGSPTVGIVELTVLDDGAVAVTRSGADRLAWLFGGAFLALLVALGPLCWWSLGVVRTQLRRTRVLALRDSLTGLANRTHFHDRLDEAIAGANRGNGKVGLIMVDLDGFKAINDTGGHAAGDRLLKRVAAGLEAATRRNEIACRLGGDEFAVVVPRLSARDELVGLADRLHERLDISVPFVDGRSLRVTASMGLAVFPDDAASADDLVGVADRSMYGVKASRRAKLPRFSQPAAAPSR